MADTLPPVSLIYAEDRSPMVRVGEAVFARWPDVVAGVEGLESPENALPVARMITHFCFRSRYAVIADSAAYEAQTRARIAAEPAGQPFQQNVIRTRSFGVPDFSTISPPRSDNGRIVWFVADAALGVPYRAECAIRESDLEKVAFDLLPLTPV